MTAIRPVVWIVAAALAAAIVIYSAYHLFGDGPRRDAAVARAQSALTAADNQSAHQAIQTILDNADAEAADRQITRSNRVTIIQAPGAGSCFSCCRPCRPPRCVPAQVSRRSS
jgi:hypothetical protein